MNIEELQEMWDVDCKIDENHLGTASTDTPKLHSKYVRHLTQTKLSLIKLKSDLNILKKNKFRYYRGELSREELTELNWNQWQGVKPLKNEMDQLLEGDEDVVKLMARIEYLETKLYMIESVMSQIKARDWQIRNSVDYMKFLAGM